MLSTETGLRCRSHLLSDRCCAGNPLWQAPGCYKWADALRDSAKAKNFIPSSDSCVADRKMRTTPPRSFSSSPYDARSHCASRACTTRSLTVTGCLLKVPTLSPHTHTRVDKHLDTRRTDKCDHESPQAKIKINSNPVPTPLCNRMFCTNKHVARPVKRSSIYARGTTKTAHREQVLSRCGPNYGAGSRKHDAHYSKRVGFHVKTETLG